MKGHLTLWGRGPRGVGVVEVLNVCRCGNMWGALLKKQPPEKT